MGRHPKPFTTRDSCTAANSKSYSITSAAFKRDGRISRAGITDGQIDVDLAVQDQCPFL
jgi:hypothetical protein